MQLSVESPQWCVFPAVKMSWKWGGARIAWSPFVTSILAVISAMAIMSLRSIIAHTEKGEKKMAKEICEDCGKVFDAGPFTFYCKACRSRRLSEAAKRRNLGQIGRDAYSKQQAEKKARMKQNGNS